MRRHRSSVGHCHCEKKKGISTSLCFWKTLNHIFFFFINFQYFWLSFRGVNHNQVLRNSRARCHKQLHMWNKEQISPWQLSNSRWDVSMLGRRVGTDSEKSETEMRRKIKTPFLPDRTGWAAEFCHKKRSVMRKFGLLLPQRFIVPPTRGQGNVSPFLRI